MYLVCHLSMIPLRKSPSDSSEMVSQILFGEAAEVLEEKDSWIHIILEYDKYSGWVDRKQMLAINQQEFERYRTGSSFCSLDLVHSISLEHGDSMQLVLGSSLPFMTNNQITFSSFQATVHVNNIETDKGNANRWLEFAMLYLNAPYLWGGRSPFGIDCSGFTQVVLKLCGIKIQRDAAQQAQQGQLINMLGESKPGDLAFFDNADGKIVHVGFILAEGRIIHSSGKVRIDKLDHQGIYNTEQKKYTHNLRLIKRFI